MFFGFENAFYFFGGLNFEQVFHGFCAHHHNMFEEPSLGFDNSFPASDPSGPRLAKDTACVG